MSVFATVARPLLLGWLLAATAVVLAAEPGGSSIADESQDPRAVQANIENNRRTDIFYSRSGRENMSFTGVVMGNTARAKSVRGITMVGGATLQSAVRENTITDNFNDGLVIALSAFTGNVSNNFSEGNTFSGITPLGETLNAETTGHLVANTGFQATAFGAIGRGISVPLTFDFNAGKYVPQTLNGNLANKTVLAKSSVGIEIDNEVAASDILTNISNGQGILSGDVSGHTTNNDGLGGMVGDTPISTGKDTSNVANLNRGSGGCPVGVFGTPVKFTSDIMGNTTNLNTQGGGMLISDTRFTGTLLDNATVENTDDGSGLGISGANTFTGDMNQGIESFSVLLSGNTSSNVLPAGQFNFELRNNGGATFNVAPQAVNASGTVGSSEPTRGRVLRSVYRRRSLR